MLILVALLATVVGATVGTTMTLLIGNAGPEGQRGPVGAEGPEGPQGPQGDLSAAQDRITNLAGRVDGLNAKVDRLESSPSSDLEGQIRQLDSRIADLEALSSSLCFKGDLIC